MSTQLSEAERTQVATIRHLQLELINKYAPQLNREGMQRLQATITPQMPQQELQRLIEAELANKQTQATERAMVRHMQLEIINKNSQGLSPVSIKKLQETINPNMSKPELMSLIEHQRTFDNTSGIEGRISLVESKIIHEKQLEILAREAAGLPPSSQARLRAQLSPNLPRERLTAAIAEEKRTVADLQRELGTSRPTRESVSPQKTRSALQSFIEGRVGLAKASRLGTHLREAETLTFTVEEIVDLLVKNKYIDADKVDALKKDLADSKTPASTGTA